MAERFYTTYDVNGPNLDILTAYGMLLIFDPNFEVGKKLSARLSEAQ